MYPFSLNVNKYDVKVLLKPGDSYFEKGNISVYDNILYQMTHNN